MLPGAPGNELKDTSVIVTVLLPSETDTTSLSGWARRHQAHNRRKPTRPMWPMPGPPHVKEPTMSRRRSRQSSGQPWSA